jgi:membrane protein implicated in regulation of membrane protease activity
VQATFALAVALLALALLILVAGLTPFVAIPLAVLVFFVPVVWFAAAGRRAAEKRGTGETVDKSGVPSSRAASYDPVVDPKERGP